MFPSPFPSWISFAQTGPAHPDEAVIHPDEWRSLGTAADLRRCSFARGRIAAHRAAANLGHRGIVLPRQEDGAPAWPSSLVGSISHTGAFAVAAVAHAEMAGGVGLDIEDVSRLSGNRCDVIERLLADPDERKWISGDAARLMRLFSAKEAIFKAFYPKHGSKFGFDAVSLDADGSGFSALLRQDLANWTAGSRINVVSRQAGAFVLSAVWLPSDARLGRP